MKITLSGSIQFESRMAEIAAELGARGYETERPKLSDRGDAPEVTDEVKSKLIRDYFAKIDSSEALLVVNEKKNGVEGYIGGSAFMEMSHAFDQGLDIFLLNPIPEMSYTDEIRGMRPIILGGKLEVLDEYIASLPLVYMSTTSAPKQRGVSRAMRRAGIPVRVEGQKFESGVAEQPMTIAETYEGAMNRQRQLLDGGVKADYYVTVEAGLHPIHDKHNVFGCDVILLDRQGEETVVAINIDVEFPRELLDGIPEKYADVGVLVKEKYGHFEKDVYPFLTGGALTRSNLIEDTLYRALVKRKDLTYGRV